MDFLKPWDESLIGSDVYDEEDINSDDLDEYIQRGYDKRDRERKKEEETKKEMGERERVGKRKTDGPQPSLLPCWTVNDRLLEKLFEELACCEKNFQSRKAKSCETHREKLAEFVGVGESVQKNFKLSYRDFLSKRFRGFCFLFPIKRRWIIGFVLERLQA